MIFIYRAFAYLCLVVVTSVVSFAAYGFDKKQACAGGRRVPEQTLHVLALLGGWPGALFGQRYFRHKTQKVSFRLLFWGTVVAHVALVVSLTLGLIDLSSVTEAIGKSR